MGKKATPPRHQTRLALPILFLEEMVRGCGSGCVQTQDRRLIKDYQHINKGGSRWNDSNG